MEKGNGITGDFTLMFGPNITPSFDHRSKEFKALYQSCVQLFKKQFQLSNDSIVLFVTGSGTLANEIVLFSSSLTPIVSTTGEFSRRIKQTSEFHHRNPTNSKLFTGVCYETADSKKFDCYKSDFVDCVSSFPYYAPEGKIWTTVTSKQLGAITGLSVIVVKDRETFDNVFAGEEPSYLSIRRYFDKAQYFQTPNTPNIHGLMDLKKQLESFNLEEHILKINTRRTMIKMLCNLKGIEVYGDGPVMTFAKDAFSESFLNEFEIYQNSGRPQIFLWSGTVKEYEVLYHSLENL